MKKTNKLISILIAVAMLLSMAPISAFAAAAPPTVEIGGKTYYEIDSADDLDWFAAQVNSGNTAINASLTKNITYNSGTMSASTTGARVWTPVGTRDNPFTGIFNGNGYTISGLYCKDPEDSPYLSLVAHSVKAIIANVAVTNFYFESRYGLVAGIASYAAGSTITNCYAQGSIYAKDGGAAAAGICAAVFGHSRTEILNCLADVALKVDDPSDFTVSGSSVRNYIGGIICTGDKNNPVLIQKTIYITDRYNGPVYDSDYALASHFEIYDSEGMPASKLSTGEIAYALGNGWGQKLGTDPMPVILSADKVNYGYISCDVDAEKVYTNSAINPNYPWHYDSETDSDSACDFCGINLHTHSFEYTASGDTITAVCENTDGSCPDPEGTLTILAPADLYADGITAKEATIENNLVDTSVAISDITYSAPYGLPPKDAGTYTASVTVGGATATVEFTLLNYAAKVTDKDGNAVGNYKTFAEAVTAASASEGSTLTLLDDVTLSSTQYVSSGKFTLDLNGKTLLNETEQTIRLQPDADVTIKDSGEGGTIQTNAELAQAILNYGTLTIEDGLFKGAAGINNSGTLNFKNGRIEAGTYSAIEGSGTVYIYDGTFESSKRGAITVNPGGTAYIYGGEFSGSYGITNHGAAYIFGGEFNGNNYAALNILKGTVEVTGGSFTGTDNEYGSFAGTPYGEFTVSYSDGATLVLKGGEFPNGFVVDISTANTFLAEGYAFYDKDGNKISVADDAKIIDGYVQVKEHLVASVTDKDGNEIGTYNTLADAITAASASEGSILTLLDDITLTETARISSGKFILDLNGKTILNKTDNVLMIYYDANITIKDSREGGTVETGGDYCYGISNLAELTVESGTIRGNGSGISNHGTLTVNGGNFESYTYGAITNKATAKIYGGVFEGIDRGEGIQNDANGEIYIYGGKICGDTALLNTGTAYISGGEFISSDYAALNILKGTVEVTGGSFTGTDFSDGYFSGTPYGEWTIDIDEGATLILKGGEFPNGFVIDETTANTFLAEDYYYKDADGKLIDVADDATIINGYVKVRKGADLADAVITLDETQFTYSGMEHKPTVIVTVGGKTLTEGKDYTLTFANNVNAGTATVTIKAIGQAAGGIAGGGENIGNSSNSGDITESVYTGEVTKEFTINKKPVTVTATAPDKIYDGTTDIDYDTIVITFDGIVEGDTVGYTIKEAWFNGIVVGTDWPVPIVYNVTGEDANNYTFPSDGEYIAPDYFVEATADITAKDISDGFIILGEALIYNGTEQIQTVEKVLTTNNLEATYTVSGNKATNVGVYLLTVTGTGNFTGEAKIAYEIALDDECISHLDRVEDNGVMKWNVKSTDRESLEYVIDQLNNAVTDIADADKKSEWADIKEACEDMLRIINSIELFIADVEEDYAGFSEDTVKSSDIPALDKIVSKVNEIKDRYGFNLTDEEAKKLEDILDGIEKLKAKIAETAEEIERIDEAVNGYDEETVTSDDIPELDKLIEDIKALTDGDNLTEDERAALEANDEAIDELVEKLAEVAEEIKKVDEAVKSYSEETVKSTDKEDLAQLKEDIQALIDSTNTTENEKTTLEEMIKDIEGLEDKITETEEKLEEIKDIENNFNPETVSSEDKAAIEDKIAEIEAVNPDNLTDEQREEYEEIKAGFEALLEEIAAAEKNVADIGAELEMFDEKRVTKFWEDDIGALKAKIDELLADENMGEAEKAKLDEYKAQAEKLIEIINTSKEYFSLRFFYLIWDAINWLVNRIVLFFNRIF